MEVSVEDKFLSSSYLAILSMAIKDQVKCLSDVENEFLD